MQEWKKIDLHLHTLKTTRDQVKTINDDNIEDFVNTIKKNQVKLIAITNHNNFDVDQFDKIRHHAKDYFEVIPGVEVNCSWEIKNNKKIPFQFNLLFEVKETIKNGDIINEKLKKLNIKNNDNTFSNQFLNKNDFFELITSLNGRVILCLDYMKSQSNLTKIANKIPNLFWFHFDIYEGNKKANIEILNREIEKILSNLNSQEKIEKALIFGTDNKNYITYPDNNERKGWIGTFLYTEATFEGLLIAIDFPQFIVKKEEKPEIAPELGDVPISKFKYKYANDDEQDIELDRGVNVILGRRGTGKTKLIEHITEIATNQGLKFLNLNQNYVSTIIEKSTSDNSTFLFDEILRMNLGEIIKNFKNINYEKFKFNDENRKYENIELNHLFNSLYEFVSIEKNNIEITKEEKLLNEINAIFGEFLKPPKLSKEVNDVRKLFNDNFDNQFLKLLLREVNIKEVDKQFLQKQKKDIEKINIEFKEDRLNRKDLSSIENEQMKEMDKVKEIILNNKKTYDLVLKNILEINKSISKKYELKNVEIPNLKMDIFLKKEFLEFKDIINEIGGEIKINKLYTWIQGFYTKCFWEKNEFNFKQNKNKTYLERNHFKIESKFKNKDISKLSPGQIAEEYIGDIFSENKHKIIIIDQPEDQLDAETVSEKIIEPIRKKYNEYLKVGGQIIFVTHDPKIAINLGPTVIIECRESKNNYTKTILKLSDIYNKNSIIAKKVDGKKEYVHTRSRIYGKTNQN